MQNLAFADATSAEDIAVTNPFDGSVVDRVHETTAANISWLLQQAMRGAQLAKALPRHRRAAILEKAAVRIEAEHEEFALLIVREAGKTITQAGKEVARCVNTLKLAAEEDPNAEG